jgi:hypothetical protein
VRPITWAVFSAQKRGGEGDLLWGAGGKSHAASDGIQPGPTALSLDPSRTKQLVDAMTLSPPAQARRQFDVTAGCEAGIKGMASPPGCRVQSTAVVTSIPASFIRVSNLSSIHLQSASTSSTSQTPHCFISKSATSNNQDEVLPVRCRCSPCLWRIRTVAIVRQQLHQR